MMAAVRHASSAGAIAGAIVGVVAFIISLLAIAYWLRKRHERIRSEAALIHFGALRFLPLDLVILLI